jgi:hypothetical protein
VIYWLFYLTHRSGWTPVSVIYWLFYLTQKWLDSVSVIYWLFYLTHRSGWTTQSIDHWDGVQPPLCKIEHSIDHWDGVQPLHKWLDSICDLLTSILHRSGWTLSQWSIDCSILYTEVVELRLSDLLTVLTYTQKWLDSVSVIYWLFYLTHRSGLTCLGDLLTVLWSPTTYVCKIDSQ